MSNIDTVLFDFDGTVMNTNDVILMSWQHTFRTLENREEDPERLINTFGEPLEQTMKKFFPDVFVPGNERTVGGGQRKRVQDSTGNIQTVQHHYAGSGKI